MIDHPDAQSTRLLQIVGDVRSESNEKSLTAQIRISNSIPYAQPGNRSTSQGFAFSKGSTMLNGL